MRHEPGLSYRSTDELKGRCVTRRPTKHPHPWTTPRKLEGPPPPPSPLLLPLLQPWGALWIMKYGLREFYFPSLKPPSKKNVSSSESLPCHTSKQLTQNWRLNLTSAWLYWRDVHRRCLGGVAWWQENTSHPVASIQEKITKNLKIKC